MLQIRPLVGIILLSYYLNTFIKDFCNNSLSNIIALNSSSCAFMFLSAFALSTPEVDFFFSTVPPLANLIKLPLLA
jgi:hypothetical protein